MRFDEKLELVIMSIFAVAAIGVISAAFVFGMNSCTKNDQLRAKAACFEKTKRDECWK